VTWPLPEPAAGGGPGVKPGELGELSELGELGVAAPSSDGRTADPPVGEPPAGTRVLAWPAVSGRATARVAAVATLASATVVVTEPTLARAASRAAARCRIAFSGEL
jgi:hypothetical protein